MCLEVAEKLRGCVRDVPEWTRDALAKYFGVGIAECL